MSGADARMQHARRAFLWACALDVEVAKPGNVSRSSAGHDMHAEQFLDSADAAAEALFTPGLRVGARIEGAIAATRAAVGCNTNLGIVLLCAPLAAAQERTGRGTSLRAACEAVLQALDVEDARAAYRAIALANPGGLGEVAAQDVAAAPTVDLRAAMALAAARDSVARQYANGYADIFDRGLAILGEDHLRRADAVRQVFLAFLAGWPDSHIVRKHGQAVAQSVTRAAGRWRNRLRRIGEAGDEAGLAAWDLALKQRGINPGTSADLTVCCLFVAALLRPDLVARRDNESWHGMCIQS